MEDHRRTILLAYNPSKIINSQQLYEWSISNILRPNLDHVYLFSVIHIPKLNFPIITDHVWSNNSNYYSSINNSNISEHDEYQACIKYEQECAKKILQNLANELSEKNITSDINISKGDVREELLNACNSLKPDLILIGSSSKKSKIFNFFYKSTLDYIKNNLKNIPVYTCAEKIFDHEQNHEIDEK